MDRPGGRRVSNSEIPILVSEVDLPRLHRSIRLAAGGRQERTAEELDAAIAGARVVPVAEVPPDLVIMGSRVAFEDEHTRARRVVTLVFPEEADAAAARISVLAPLGAALLGLRAGQRTEWVIPNGRTTRIRILSVEQQPTAGAAAATS